jgi:hypothetical protein
LKGLERDKSVNNLNDKLDRLWPEGDGNSHGRRDRNYDDDDIGELTRQLSLKYDGQWFFYASKIVGLDRLASWWY